MKNYREILVQFTVRILIAIPFFMFGWYLIASARKDWGSIAQLLFAMACFVGSAIIVAPPIARLFAEPAGALHYPTEHSGRPQPEYRIPESRKQQGHYEEAILEYEKIAKDFPEEVKPYIDMIDITVVNLEDRRRAEAIYERALSVLINEDDRDLLRIMHESITSGLSREP